MKRYIRFFSLLGILLYSIAVHAQAIKDGNGSTISYVFAPTVRNISAGFIAENFATLKGEVTPNGYATSYFFQWGTSAGSYTDSSPVKSLQNTTYAETVSFKVTGLLSATTYYYRLSATNENGTTLSSEGSFTTATANSGYNATLVGSITSDTTLNAAYTYRIIGFVNIYPGAVLTIPAGTRLIGFRGDRATLQTIRGDGTLPSGKIIANGTKQLPIVFTSGEADGSKARGDIGGIILNGLAINNVPGGNRVGEGGAALGGGNDDADNSGTLKYVRVEFGGTVVSEGNEVNGFSFNSVGDGTTLEHLQSHFIADDGYEWWGGTVNAKYLVSSGVVDDNFDMDNGWRGSLQFAVCIQDVQVGNSGFESSNDDDGSDNTPLTHPMGYNVTLVGAYDGSKEDDGLSLMRNMSGTFKNIIIANFADYGVYFKDDKTASNFMDATAGDDDKLTLSNFMVYCQGATGTNNDTAVFNPSSKVGSSSVAAIEAELAANTVFGGNPQWAYAYPEDPFEGTVPDLMPTAAEAVDSAATIVADDFLEATSYIGAFDPDGPNWMDGWTNWHRASTTTANQPAAPVPTPSSFSCEALDEKSIALAWDGTSPEFHVVMKQGSMPTSSTDGILVYQGANKVDTATGLSARTVYCFAVYGKDGDSLSSIGLTGLDTTKGISSAKENPVSSLNYGLEQNYPNPFNPSTTIGFSLKQPGNVDFTVYDITGRVIFRKSATFNAGTHQIQFNAEGLSSGVYFYHLQSDNFISTKKMLLLK